MVAAIRQLKAAGASADGQVAATRRTAKKLAAVARARGASVVVIDETPVRKGLRRMIEGDVGAELRRKLRNDGIEVEIVPTGMPRLTHDPAATPPDPFCTLRVILKGPAGGPSSEDAGVKARYRGIPAGSFLHASRDPEGACRRA